ncbi:phytanoyl-CoA dioxygenase family protein [Phenylobacterium terrae]|uniref:Phytanoyl-CoA dioxygenase family protein n=2 Tax=Phenylobacterium terrae TaxID=2665495 RepID=A0ABW4N4K8_9CAUL
MDDMAAAPAGLDVGPHVEAMRRDGYTIIEDFLSPAQIEAVRTGLHPFLGHYRGRNDFEGHKTERVYTLVARAKVFQDVAEEPRLMAILGQFLQPRFLLTASQAICIYPGETAQRLHTDDSFYPIPRPRPAISITVIVAVDPFTEQNGATVIVPGSHRWSNEQLTAMQEARLAGRPVPEVDEGARPAVMAAGAALVMLGTLLHGGGANRSDAPRLAFTNQYCEPWVRTQENFFLAIPKEMVREYSPRVRELLGYDTRLNSFMGMVTASTPAKALEPGWVPPVVRQAAQGD